jgi:hypothetical protein
MILDTAILAAATAVGLPILRAFAAIWLWYSLRAIHYTIIPRACIASAVAVAWLTLFLAGGLRPERSWIDRFGSALGLGWIVVGFGYAGVAFLFP